ncbi:transketolase [Verrucomicrobiales bacterium]|jgi:transketolase|nr:transketolase [Verrucomicrobiales bacterium]MDB2496072.1 transketolase [Verrucomicrobiales bacterium]MDB2642331.1 transketolase [bacterium]MDB3941304.1 transketolase [Verrucomicrobiales bacterium]
MSDLNQEALSRAAAEARGLAIDAVHACSSGHLGLPLGAADIGAVLYGQAMTYNPAEPKWLNRDRFILSAGHGSMFLYGWLHLSGYNLSLEEVKNFRQLHSITPGHPEFDETDGVEATTGPLGQGVGNAVGYALSAKMAAAKYNTDEHTIFDQTIFCLAGDGCLQEGVASEAIAFAGHNGLDNLVLIYDSNDVTLDAMADVTQSYDTLARFEAFGWNAVQVNGHDMSAVLAAVEEAKANTNGKPTLIEAKTIIGKGIPEVEGTAAGHGEGGANFAETARAGLGLPKETFFVSDETKNYFASHLENLKATYSIWEDTFGSWKASNPQLASQLADAVDGRTPDDLLSRIPEFDSEYKNATRAAGGEVIQAVAEAVPNLVTGSADLFGSTKNYIKSSGDLSKDDFGQKNIWYGIREHAMGAICNGLAYDGIFLATGATFAVFADYLRPSIRLAGLAHLPVGYILTHDSIGVGEDGPTHQPVETVSGVRVIPNVDVIRPADPEETAGAFAAMVERKDGPTALFLTRQAVPTMNEVPVSERREGVFRGAYVAKKETGDLDTILIGTGSELQHALEAAKSLGDGVRVVSMPCMERFDRQSDEYRESILPAACTKRVAIEAGVSAPWYKYVGSAGTVIGIDRFGISAPGNTVMSELGMTAENVVETVQGLG